MLGFMVAAGAALMGTLWALSPTALSMRALPSYGFAPHTASLMVSAKGPDEDLYCAAETWDFGDGETSVVIPDCPPWEPGMTARHYYERRHTYAMAGIYEARLTLSRGERIIGTARASVEAIGWEEGKRKRP